MGNALREPQGERKQGWLVERTARLAVGQSDGVLSDINFGEVFPFVAKPLARDGLARYIGPTLGGQVAGLSRHDPLVFDLNPIAFVAGRPYMDLSAYYNFPAIAYQRMVLEAVDQVKGKAIADLVRARRLHPIPISLAAKIRLHLAYARMGLRSFGWLLHRRTPIALRDAYALTTDRLREAVRRPLEQESPAALLADLDREFDNETDPTKDGLRHLGLAMYLHLTLHQLLAGRVPQELIDNLDKGIPHNPTTTISLDLWTLAVEARPLTDLFAQTPPDRLRETLRATEPGRQWWERFEAFLRQHGHRGEVELDLTTPRWREDPTFLLQTITNYLRHPDGTATPPDLLAEGLRRREAAASTIREHLGFPLRTLFGWLYDRYMLWHPFREHMKYTWLLGLEQARRVYRELGRRLAAAGHLQDRDDIFWLQLAEVRGWADTGSVTWASSILESRKREWQAWTEQHPPSLVIGRSGIEETVLSVPLPGSRVLRGTAVSPGKAEGIARVILSPHQAELRPGEILVTRYTDPAWTPLFFTAGALVTEVGGMLSHGAVVAREIGLPAVAGVEDATAYIESGRRIKVDASAGTVELL